MDNVWRDPSVAFTDGISTTDDVLRMLGPPSQVIALGERTVVYYVRESSRGRAYVTFIYNLNNITVTYDRAVFFFDDKGILTAHSYSKETIRRPSRLLKNPSAESDFLVFAVVAKDWMGRRPVLGR